MNLLSCLKELLEILEILELHSLDTIELQSKLAAQVELIKRLITITKLKKQEIFKLHKFKILPFFKIYKINTLTSFKKMNFNKKRDNNKSIKHNLKIF